LNDVKTLLLDRTVWDLCKDASGNIALAAEPYAVLQDVGSAARLFLGELWYDTSRGVPYFEQVLGRPVSLGTVKALIVRAALTVPLVAAARMYVSSFEDRVLAGQVQSLLITGGAPIITPVTLGIGKGAFVLDTSVLGGADVMT
jgi:hypothetical protein